MIDLSRFTQLWQASILVVGDAMLDRYFMGDTQRISPEAPVPVVKVFHIEDRAGGAANVARNIAQLDGQASLLGLIGQDLEGELLRGILSRENVHSELISQAGIRTISKSRIISHHQQMIRLDVEEMFSLEHADAVKHRVKTLIDSYDTVIVSDYAKGTLGAVDDIITLAAAAGKRVLVDPKSKDFSLYRGATIITPNLTEFRLAGGDDSSEDAILVSARTMLTNCDIDNMLLTRGEQGMSLITPEQYHHFPAEVLDVSDVTGAGDTVIATLGAMVSAGYELIDAVWLANQAAGIVVGKLGTATVSPEELAARVWHAGSVKIAGYHPSVKQSLLHIDYAREQGERIVFTNGCFDILHAGHVRYLAKARALGDRLVVGLNSDDSVRRLKGLERPVNSLEDRMEVLTALACVDWVLPFGDNVDENDTPEQLIRRVRPQILAKGGDYTVDTVVGASFVQKSGGEIAVIPLLEGRSTTELIARVRG